MIDALIKRVSVTYKCYEMYAHRFPQIFWGGNGVRLIDTKRRYVDKFIDKYLSLLPSYDKSTCICVNKIRLLISFLKYVKDRDTFEK
jgi:hypothetical protein